MSLNRVDHPTKVRNVEKLIGRRVERVVSRFFENQNDWLVICEDGSNWRVNLRNKTHERHRGACWVATETGIRPSGNRTV